MDFDIRVAVFFGLQNIRFLNLHICQIFRVINFFKGRNHTFNAPQVLYFRLKNLLSDLETELNFPSSQTMGLFKF